MSEEINSKNMILLNDADSGKMSQNFEENNEGVNKLIQNSDSSGVVLSEDSNSNEDEEDYRKDRKWFGKYFSSMQPGSIRASIFSLSILSIGSGTMAMPQRFGQLSIVLSIILAIFYGICVFTTLNLLSISTFIQKSKTYSSLVEKACGVNWKRFLNFILIFYTLQVLIVLQSMSKFLLLLSLHSIRNMFF